MAGGADSAQNILSSAELYTPDEGGLTLVSAASSKKQGNAGIVQC